MKLKKLPRYILDQISTRITVLQLIDDVPPAEAKKRAIAEVAKETGYKSIKPSALLKPTHRRAITGAAYEDYMWVYQQLMRDPAAVFKRKPSPPSPSLDRRSPAAHSVRRERQATPDVEPTPAPKHHTELLYTSGGLSGGGLRSGAVNLNHEFRDDAATLQWRLDQSKEWK